MKKYILSAITIYTLAAVLLSSCKKAGNINGEVKDSNDNLIENAKVEISPSVMNSILTNSTGDFNFVDLDEGVYKITVSKEGFETSSKDITVEKGQTSNADFVLKTAQLIPLLTAGNPVPDGYDKATVEADITDLGAAGVINSHGLVWSTSPAPTISLPTKVDYGMRTSIGKFIGTVTELSENTKYYIRAYATNINGTAYSNEVSFTTIILASVNTTPVTDITQTTATSGGNITSDGGNSVTTRGVCWSTNQIPTINDNKSTDGSGIGSFTSSLTGLNPNTTYYVRAYATTSEGTAYGSQESFTTDNSIQLEGFYSAYLIYRHPVAGTYPDNIYFEGANCKELSATSLNVYKTLFANWTDTCWITINQDNTLAFEVSSTWSYDVQLGDPYDASKISHYDPVTGIIYLYYNYWVTDGYRIFWEEFTPTTVTPVDANAGEDQIFLDNTTSTVLNANSPLSNVGTWEIIKGVDGSFGSINYPNSVFSGNSCSYYILKWSITGECVNSNDEVKIAFNETTINPSNTDFVGNWGGVDGYYSDFMYPTSVTVTESGNSVYAEGVNFEWMQQFWGETILSSNPFAITINQDGTLNIADQLYMTTDYNGNICDYNISGTGIWSNCSGTLKMELFYDMYNTTDIYSCAEWAVDLGFSITPYFIAEIELGAKSVNKKIIIKEEIKKPGKNFNKYKK